MPPTRADIISQLQTDIHRLEGFKPNNSPARNLVLGPMQKAFPNGSFPLGAVHEFLSNEQEDMAALNGFITGLISKVMPDHGTTLWISSHRRLFPPALTSYGIQPERCIFVDVSKEGDVMPVLYEALKCSAISAVVAESRSLDFTTSRRLQLAVEQSQATGFVIRNHVKNPNTTACISRWKVSSLPSASYEELPGIGFSKWRVELLRMRNGKTGAWEVQWIDGKFAAIEEASIKSPSIDQSSDKQRKAG